MTRDDIWIFAKTIWAEARGEPLDGQIAVANVILNRAQQGGWWGDDVVKVCRKPKQFSYWNKSDPNRAKMDGLELQDRAFARAIWRVSRCLTRARPTTRRYCRPG